MRLRKKILIGLLVVFITIQFIQPARNISEQTSVTDIQKVYAAPDSISTLLKNSCYDCHSNNTRYPWYSFIQPGGWWMSSHVRKGKADLNLSEFGSYSRRKQQSKLQAIVNSINDNTMPLRSYSLLHNDAVLSGDQKRVIITWTTKIKDSLSNQ